jgi:KDO2-lipid IV(A) lauroyltransferase
VSRIFLFRIKTLYEVENRETRPTFFFIEIFFFNMKFIGYLFFRFVLGIFWLMPFSVLYAVSDFVAWVLQRVVKYRLKVVRDNLRFSFPEKSTAELADIERKSYKNLADVLLEGLKGFTMNEATVRKRYTFTNQHLVNNSNLANGNSILMAAHFGNWEWGVIAVPYFFERTVVGFYKPLSNPYIDKLVRQRHEGGTKLVNIAQTARAFTDFGDKNCTYIFVSDQSTWSKNAHTVTFFHQETKCPYGGDKYARLHDFPVYYLDIQRVKRGFYNVDIKPLALATAHLAEGNITKIYMEHLEKIIRAKPEDWLWSHKRWKNLRP